MCTGFQGWSGAIVWQVAIKTLRREQRRAMTAGPLTIYILLPDDFLVSATGLLWGGRVGAGVGGLTEWHRKVKMLGYKRIKMWVGGSGWGVVVVLGVHTKPQGATHPYQWESS